MVIWIVLGVVVVAAGVYAFWPRAGGLDARIRRTSAIAQGRAGNYDGTSGNTDAGGGAGGS